MNPVLFSSATDEWPTPAEFFDLCDVLHGPFDVDVCADASNAKCASFYTKEQNSLTKKMGGRGVDEPSLRGPGDAVQEERKRGLRV